MGNGYLYKSLRLMSRRRYAWVDDSCVNHPANLSTQGLWFRPENSLVRSGLSSGTIHVVLFLESHGFPAMHAASSISMSYTLLFNVF